MQDETASWGGLDAELQYDDDQCNNLWMNGTKEMQCYKECYTVESPSYLSCLQSQAGTTFNTLSLNSWIYAPPNLEIIDIATVLWRTSESCSSRPSMS